MSLGESQGEERRIPTTEASISNQENREIEFREKIMPASSGPSGFTSKFNIKDEIQFWARSFKDLNSVTGPGKRLTKRSDGSRPRIKRSISFD